MQQSFSGNCGSFSRNSNVCRFPPIVWTCLVQGLGRFPEACLCPSRFHLTLARPGGTRGRATNGVEAHTQTPVQTRGKRESCSSVPCTILGEVEGCSRDGEGLHGGLTGQTGCAAGTAHPLPGTGCTYRVHIPCTR
jgi:hypothetical protein